MLAATLITRQRVYWNLNDSQLGLETNCIHLRIGIYTVTTEKFGQDSAKTVGQDHGCHEAPDVQE